MVCAAKGYPLVVTMPDSASIERRKLMRFLGAKVLLTPAEEGGTGAYNKAKKLVIKNNWFFAKQFENEDNSNIHEKTTGEEIFNDFKNIGLDYWVSGYGTGGTFTGVSRVLREKMPQTKLILTEPDVAQLVGSNQKQIEMMMDLPLNLIQIGIHTPYRDGPDFIPLVLQESIDNKYFDELIPVSGNDGIFGLMNWHKRRNNNWSFRRSTFAIAIEIAKKLKKVRKYYACFQILLKDTCLVFYLTVLIQK
ncbi:MAG: hypothetical protein CM15mP108_1080 [Gammaproteobacteria bacterium]|nr:MAG: hypothetical protein CM15mP108_1080 [Gammaproteobacteria bacterium]